MHSIVIIAEQNIGKLIQKYLEREPYSVVYADSLGSLGPMEAGFAIVDQSHLEAGTAHVLQTLIQEHRCTRFVVLCSMENNEACTGAELKFPNAEITKLVKPIKLSQLAQIIRYAMEETV